MKYGRTDFPSSVKLAAWQRCGGYCEEPACRTKIMGGAIYDHIVPANLRGPSTLENCQVLCKRCDRIKTGQQDIPAISKVKRTEARRAGLRRPSKSWRKRVSNTRHLDEERENG